MCRLAPLLLGAFVLVAGVSVYEPSAQTARNEVGIKTERPILALAIKGSDVAWLTSNEYSTGGIESLSLWLQTSGKTAQLSWPKGVRFDTYFGAADLSIARGNVGWVVATHEGNYGETVYGASSARTGKATLFGTNYDDGSFPTPGGGKFLTNVTASGDEILWGTATVAVRDTAEAGLAECDLWAGEGCKTRILGGAINRWVGDESKRIKGLPPSAALAADGKLIALAIWPRGPLVKGGYPPLGAIRVSTLGGRVLTRIKPPRVVRDEPVGMEMAFSQRLLALHVVKAVALYAVPSGRFLRRVHLLVGEEAFAVTRKKLVLWNEHRLLVVDSRSGRHKRISVSGATTITAVATDGDRLAWAQTNNQGQSNVRIIHVG